jgi:hypothetical protein
VRRSLTDGELASVNHGFGRNIDKEGQPGNV